jgi:hypothetical protein
LLLVGFWIVFLILGTLGRLMAHCGAWLCFLRLLLLVILGPVVLGAGCRRADPVDAVALMGVDSPVISAEAPLELRAEGLPTARRVNVALHGRLAAAGQDERELDVSLMGHVLSPERLSIAVDPAVIARWGRATFVGSVVVDCDPPSPRGCHGALAQVRFDVELLGERRAQPLHYAVQRLLPALGLSISDADSATFGLLVSAVRPGSLAERAGLRLGDTIVRSNGVSLHALADLAPGPSADALALGVRRGETQLSLRVPLADAPPLADLRLLGVCVVVSPLLLLLLARLGMPAPALLVSGLRARLATLRSSAGWPLAAGAVLSGSLGMYLALAAHVFDPLILLLVHLGGVVLLRGLRGEGAQRFAADVLGVGAATLCVAAVSGTRAWPLLLRDQGALPWAWNALARLPLSAACVLFVLSAARLHGSGGQQRMAAQLWEEGLCALLAGMCASLFFGGVHLAADAGVFALVFGALLAAAKAVCCYVLLKVLADVALTSSRKWLWVSLVALTPIWTRLAPSRSFELLWGSAACVMCACVALAGLLSSRGALATPEPQPVKAKPKTVRKRAPTSDGRKPAPTRQARPVPQTQP